MGLFTFWIFCTGFPEQSRGRFERDSKSKRFVDATVYNLVI